MKPLLFPLLVLLGCAAGAADAAAPAGEYRLTGEQDVASGLRLEPDGDFQYFLIAGALDEQAEGRWQAAGGVVTLKTEPPPVPPAFEARPPAKTRAAALTVTVSSPAGRGLAGVDLRVGFDRGAPVEAYTQEDGWSLPPDEKRRPRWIELRVPMHDIVSPRFAIDPAAGNALAFTLVPNDLGVVDLDGIRIEMEGEALVMHRRGARLRYEPVRE